MAPMPFQMILSLQSRTTVVSVVPRQALYQPKGPGIGPGLHPDIRQDLVGSLVSDGLGAQQGRNLGLKVFPFCLLEEEDPVGEVFVIGTDLLVDDLVVAEVTLRRENHRDQGKLGLVDRELLATECVDQAAVQRFEQPAAVLGECLGGLVEDQVVVGLENLIVGIGPLVQESSEPIHR